MCFVVTVPRVGITEQSWDKQVLPMLKREPWVAESYSCYTVGFHSVPHFRGIPDRTPAGVLMTKLFEDHVCAPAMRFSAHAEVNPEYRFAKRIQLIQTVEIRRSAANRISLSIAKTTYYRFFLFMHLHTVPETSHPIFVRLEDRFGPIEALREVGPDGYIDLFGRADGKIYLANLLVRDIKDAKRKVTELMKTKRKERPLISAAFGLIQR
jgi:hypothetical protein